MQKTARAILQRTIVFDLTQETPIVVFVVVVDIKQFLAIGNTVTA